MEIKLVTFDLDNTLWASDEVLLRATRTAEAWIHQRVQGYQEIGHDHLSNLRASLVRRYPEVAYDVTAFRIRYWQARFLELGMEDQDALLMANSAFEVFIEVRCQVEPYDQAEPLLAALKPDFLLATLTNGNSNVSQTSLGPYFSFTLTAGEAGAAKPSREIFDVALERAGVSDPGQAIHVGDSLRDDVEGAANAGMKTVWVDYQHQPKSSRATTTVHNLRDVEAAIRRIAV